MEICQDTGLHKASSFNGSMSCPKSSISNVTKSWIESRPGASNERGLLDVSSPPRRGLKVANHDVVLGFVQPWLCPCKTLRASQNQGSRNCRNQWRKSTKAWTQEKIYKERRNGMCPRAQLPQRDEKNLTPLVPNASCDSFLQCLLHETVVWQHSR